MKCEGLSEGWGGVGGVQYSICSMGFLKKMCSMLAVNELCHGMVNVGLSRGDSRR